MNVTLDHIFILCDKGAPEAEVLTRAGIKEGSSNTHPGQGTACRRFFFTNAYLELLWVEDAALAQSERVRPTRLWERWQGRGKTACPFGLVLRPADGNSAPPPFETWAYRPDYLPEGLAIEFAKDTPLSGPEILYLGFQNGRARVGQEPTEHRIPANELTSITLQSPRSGCSAALDALQDAGMINIKEADEYCLELHFAYQNEKTIDVRPALPLVLQCK